MTIITPTLTAYNQHQYREQLDRLKPFAKRIHLDLMDGEFAKTRSIDVDQLYWYEEFEKVDLHLMFQDPTDHIDQLIDLRPTLIVFHAESKGDIFYAMNKTQSNDIAAGVSLLQETSVESCKDLIAIADHVLIFSGALGSYGGQVDFTLTDKIKQIREINADCEIAWDGGVNKENAKRLQEAGVNVLNVGGAIARSEDPQAAYEELAKIIQ